MGGPHRTFPVCILHKETEPFLRHLEQDARAENHGRKMLPRTEICTKGPQTARKAGYAIVQHPEGKECLQNSSRRCCVQLLPA